MIATLYTVGMCWSEEARKGGGQERILKQEIKSVREKKI